MTTPSLTFRRAIPDDSELLSALCYRAKQSHGYSDAMMEAWAAEGDMVISQDSIANNTIMMALIGDRVVGFAHLMPVETPDTIYLEDLFIEPDVQGQGIGKALFDWALTEAGDRGYAWLEWDSDPNSATFYVKMGGEKIGEQKSTVVDGRIIPKFRRPTGPKPPDSTHLS
jgi:GNAT superfamily N-acetyltransferase